MSNSEGASAPKSLKEAHGLLQEAMKAVKQELVIIDKKGIHHLVYVHDVTWNDGLQVDYSTLSDSDDIAELVHEAMQAQFKVNKKGESWSKQFWKTCSSMVNILLKFGRT